MSKCAIDRRVFEFIYGCGMSDAIMRAAYSGKESRSDLIKGNPSETVDVVEDFANRVLSGEFYGCGDFKESCDRYDKAFKETAFAVAALIPDFTFGNAQKLINIILKHLYVCGYNSPETREKFRFCHCPLDSKIAQVLMKLKFDFRKNPTWFNKEGYFLKKEYKQDTGKSLDDIYNTINNMSVSEKSDKWSGLRDEKKYMEIQNIIREYCLKDPQKYGKNGIEFDYMLWQNDD